MRHRNSNWAYRLGVLCWILLFVPGCFKADPSPDYGPLRSEVENLYLNYHALKAIHSDLHEAARRHIARGGDQLADIQSTARFIAQANLIAFYQWELLSITEYIRDSARRDFFTLRVRDVADARRKSKDLITVIQVYEAFIRDPEALEMIQQAIQQIQRNMAIFDRLAEKMAPLSNPPRALEALRPETSL